MNRDNKDLPEDNNMEMTGMKEENIETTKTTIEFKEGQEIPIMNKEDIKEDNREPEEQELQTIQLIVNKTRNLKAVINKEMSQGRNKIEDSADLKEMQDIAKMMIDE